MKLPVVHEDEYPSRPCIGSGYCCMKSQCFLSMEVHGKVEGVCPSLDWNGERHVCRLMLDGVRDPKLGVTFGPSHVKAALHEGAGCCSPLNSWRREPLKDRQVP